MSRIEPTPLAARFLEAALLFTIVAHASAMASMLLLLPALPGGGTADDAVRIAWIAEHPWLWRLGWLPWQVTAFSDVVLALALLRTPWIPRRPAIFVLLLTLAAVLPEQTGEALWITQGVYLAQHATRTGDLTDYLSFEAGTFERVAGWAAVFYTLAALGWTWCFVAAGTWSRLLTWLSIVTWTVLMAASIAPLLPQNVQPAPEWVGLANAVGFILLMAWFVAVTEQVLRRSRPEGPHGRLARWRHPQAGMLGRSLDLLANSRLARAVGERIPPVSFVSDITDVIYVNYLVEAGRLEPLLPAGLELQRLGPGGRYALFTFLTYRHGHFGPRFFGPLRRLLPSPVQSNWRIYVRDPHTGLEGIYFTTNAVSRTPHALAARLLAEGMPMHLLAHGEVTAAVDGSFRVRLDPGKGSAPDADLTLRPAAEAVLPAAWGECFVDYRAMLAYCVPQDRALSSQPWYSRVTRQEIRLGIPLEDCEPLTGDVLSRAAESVVGDAVPVCFRVARVAFRFDREAYDRRPVPFPCVPGRQG